MYAPTVVQCTITIHPVWNHEIQFPRVRHQYQHLVTGPRESAVAWQLDRAIQHVVEGHAQRSSHAHCRPPIDLVSTLLPTRPHVDHLDSSVALPQGPTPRETVVSCRANADPLARAHVT